MNDSIISGMFALSGTVLGGLIAYLTTRTSQRWERVQKDVVRLCDQVSAFYQLEQIYKDELSKLDPEKRSAKVIMEEIRSRVEKADYERPELTTHAAEKIRREWS